MEAGSIRALTSWGTWSEQMRCPSFGVDAAIAAEATLDGSATSKSSSPPWRGKLRAWGLSTTRSRTSNSRMRRCQTCSYPIHSPTRQASSPLPSRSKKSPSTRSCSCNIQSPPTRAIQIVHLTVHQVSKPPEQSLTPRPRCCWSRKRCSWPHSPPPGTGRCRRSRRRSPSWCPRSTPIAAPAPVWAGCPQTCLIVRGLTAESQLE